MSTNRATKTLTTYEKSKKEELVKLGQGTKKWREIVKYLENEIQKSKTITSFNYKILCFREDGAYQLNKAIEKINGVAVNKGEKGPSDDKERPVQTLDVKLSDGSRIKVPFGRIELPDMGQGAFVDISYDGQSNFLHVQGSCQFAFVAMMDEIITETERLLKTDSIYKNQPLEISSNFQPKVIDLSGIESQEMVLSEASEYALQSLRARIHKPELCREKGIPLKFGALLEGKYGTGKTLLAFKLAVDAIKNNWTFIYIKEPTLLARTLKLCKNLDQNGEGILVFVED